MISFEKVEYWCSPDPGALIWRCRSKRTWGSTGRALSTPWTRRCTRTRRRPSGRWWIMCCGRWQQTGSPQHSNRSRVTCGGRRMLLGESKASKYTAPLPRFKMLLCWNRSDDVTRFQEENEKTRVVCWPRRPHAIKCSKVIIVKLQISFILVLVRKMSNIIDLQLFFIFWNLWVKIITDHSLTNHNVLTSEIYL